MCMKAAVEKFVDSADMSSLDYLKVAVRLKSARRWRKGIDERPMVEAIPNIVQHGTDQDIAIDCVVGVANLIPKFMADCKVCGRYADGTGCPNSCPHKRFHMAFDSGFLTKGKNKKGKNKNG